MKIDKKQDFISACNLALEEKKLVKLTLGGFSGAIPDLRTLIVRPVLLRHEEKFSFTYRYRTRDLIKNYGAAEAATEVLRLLDAGALAATLHTLSEEWVLQIDRRTLRQHLRKNQRIDAGEKNLAHDRKKKNLIDAASSLYLRELGITGADGRVLHAAQDKFRQINKYIEILAGLTASLPRKDSWRVVDMGCGKGYLTFALYDYLTSGMGQAARMTGVEARHELTDLCNQIAARSGFAQLDFFAGRIADFSCAGVDILVALHACDTATDEALCQGIRHRVPLIIVAPCCHKQIRRQMEKATPEPGLKPLLRHGIFLERQSEMVTDTLRALLLEANGYAVKVFEFVSDAHTAKNVMITATLGGKPGKPETLAQIETLKRLFAISEHELERLLKQPFQDAGRVV